MPRIRAVTLKNGSKRYRFTIDLPHGRDEKRQQITRTFGKRKDAEAELARIGHQARTGEYVRRWNGSVSDMIGSYLQSACFEKSENTALSYRNALLPARDRLGGRLAQSVTREDIEDLRNWMLARGRRRGGTPGTGLAARSVQLTMGRLSAAFELAIMDRKLSHNPVRYVKPPKSPRGGRATWSESEVRAFLAVTGGDRLAAAWRMTLFGPRRGEILGLRWEDIGLDAMTVTIGRARVLVNGEVIVRAPKSAAGYRTLPVDEALVSALRALRRRQREERLAAGDAYQPSGYVATDELGAPLHPRWFTEEFHRIREAAGLPRIRLHDGRHTANSLMAAAGVPPHIRAAWCGHTQAVNEAVYTHARPEDLAVALGALSKIDKVV